MLCSQRWDLDYYWSIKLDSNLIFLCKLSCLALVMFVPFAFIMYSMCTYTEHVTAIHRNQRITFHTNQTFDIKYYDQNKQCSLYQITWHLVLKHHSDNKNHSCLHVPFYGKHTNMNLSTSKWHKRLYNSIQKIA